MITSLSKACSTINSLTSKHMLFTSTWFLNMKLSSNLQRRASTLWSNIIRISTWSTSKLTLTPGLRRKPKSRSSKRISYKLSTDSSSEQAFVLWKDWRRMVLESCWMAEVKMSSTPFKVFSNISYHLHQRLSMLCDLHLSFQAQTMHTCGNQLHR